MRKLVLLTPLLGVLLGIPAMTSAPAAGGVPRPTAIQHIVIQFNENHSFDHFLGDYCRRTRRRMACNVDAKTGKPFNPAAPIKVETRGGTQIAIPFVAPDISPNVDHQHNAIVWAMANEWLRIPQCTRTFGSVCFSYLTAPMVPTTASLAEHGAISDQTYSSNPVASWNAHSDLVDAGQLYGFIGNNPASLPVTAWGCDSGKTAEWLSQPGATLQRVPSCFPDTIDRGLPGFGGAFEPTPVQPNVPTLMQDLDAHGISWKMYGASSISQRNYLWSICPTFASCLYTRERSHLVTVDQFFADAAAGTLPQVSFFLPGPTSHGGGQDFSQHNKQSVMVGENMTADVYNALFSGPNGSTSVFEKTWDDCGCFYDHVLPPPVIGGQQPGIRVPAFFVGPYVKSGYTDSKPANFSSTMAMIEWLMGIPPIGNGTLPDATAYNYRGIFDFGQRPLPFVPIPTHPISRTVLQQLDAQPADTNDPT